ncbi:O-antigen translocase [Enterobacter sp. Cy-643]|uniref:O-antigen translocase n=1 Tax=Enterobacter sp. Cy-643 TaxID=2608346 RepID=UPI00141DDFAC|nr:O-antigen translocase [Enterobacter sp. Cy-643]NIF31119.1 O-antigen translocase [Enterobacter sp. Cy-643]
MKRLLKVTALSGLLTLLKMLMGFVIAKVIAVYTGPTGMAMLGQVQSLINSFNGIVNAPVSSGVVRYTAEKHASGYEKCSPWWRASLEWTIVLCAILIPAGFIFSGVLSEWLFQSTEYRWIVCLTAVCLPLAAIGTLFSSVINGLENYRRYIALAMISVVFSSAIMIAMIVFYGIKGAFVAAVLQSSLIGVVMLFANIKQKWFTLRYWWGQTHRQARRDIGGYILMAVTTAITAPVALILVRNIIIAYDGWEQAGQWQAVWKISEVYLSVITIALSTYYLPRLSSLTGADKILSEVNKTAAIVIPVAMIMALGVYLFRDIVISILFTSEFASSRELFLIQLVGDVVKIGSWLYAYPMLSRGATKWYVTTEIIFAITFVLLALVFVSLYGVHGANLAYLINYIVYFLFMVVNFKRIAK